MKKIVKQVCGIDVAQNELVVCFATLNEDYSLNLTASKTFVNKKSSFSQLLSWAQKLADRNVSLLFAMEATGVYHEQLAYFLDDRRQKVSIILPNKISNFMRTLEIKTVTDSTAAQAIARFALERSGLELWKRPKAIYRQMRNLTRERDQIIHERTMVKSQLHAERAQAFAESGTVKRLEARITLLDKQVNQILAELKALVKSDPEIESAVELLTSIDGIGELTAFIILAETDGFALIKNRRQLASYAGFDVKEKLSGTSVKGKPRISKRGNKYLRKAMYFPAMRSAKAEGSHKAAYAQIVARTGVRKKAGVAVQRKLLELTYTIFKTQKPYDPEYYKRQEVQLV